MRSRRRRAESALDRVDRPGKPRGLDLGGRLRALVPAVGVGLLAAGAALGGGACSSDECMSTRTYFEKEVWSPFMGTKCTKCHTPDGVAVAQNGAKLVLQPTSYPGFIDANLATLQEIAKIEYEGTSELLLKPIGKMNHGGGKVIDEGGPEYDALSAMLDRFKDGDSCEEAPNAALKGVANLSAAATLRKAALDLVGRLPTKEETDKVAKGGDSALDAALDAIMKEDAFYVRLREIYNDTLLTDRFLSYDGAAINFMNTSEMYPGLDPYKNGDSPKYDDPARPLINRAIAREPLNLITYVVKNDKPFTDIVRADYAVVNPFSAIAYDVVDQVQFKDPTDENELKEAHVKLGTGVDLPHAGVLSTPAFLNRWQTTPTNVNRGRARRVFKFFLATDVLKIAERPVDATKVTAEENPTLNAEYCTVCHKVIDPVAGGFRGYDDNDYEYFDPMTKWHDDMFPAGFGGKDMAPAYYGKGLVWLGNEIANDPRFQISAVYSIYKGLTGHEPLPYPQDSIALDFDTRLAAWSAQDEFFRLTADAFKKSNYNLKTIVKAVIKSPYYRADSAPDGAKEVTLQDIGTGRLLTPEMLNRKIAAVTGVHWRKPWDWENQHDWLREDYEILYGGIDSDTVPTRLTAPNGLTAAVAARMANEVACRVTGWDFTRPPADRTLFPNVELTEVPESAGHPVDGSVEDIKKNIQYLHERLLGEELAPGDPEIERTYQLFLDTWHELAASGDTDLPWECRGRWDPITGEDLPEDIIVDQDENYTVRSWMAVTTYLLSDWKFLYE